MTRKVIIFLVVAGLASLWAWFVMDVVQGWGWLDCDYDPHAPMFQSVQRLCEPLAYWVFGPSLSFLAVLASLGMWVKPGPPPTPTKTVVRHKRLNRVAIALLLAYPAAMIGLGVTAPHDGWYPLFLMLGSVGLTFMGFVLSLFSLKTVPIEAADG